MKKITFENTHFTPHESTTENKKQTSAFQAYQKPSLTEVSARRLVFSWLYVAKQQYEYKEFSRDKNNYLLPTFCNIFIPNN